MRVVLLPLAALLAIPLVSAEPTPDPVAPERDIASLLPENTLLYVEAPGLADLFDQGFQHMLVRNLMRSELGQLALAEAEVTPAQALAMGSIALGRPVLPALKSLTANGAALGVTLAPGGVAWALVLHGDDEQLFEELRLRAETWENGNGGLGEPITTIQGAEVWKLPDGVFLANRGSLILMGEGEDYLREVLDLASDADAAGLTVREDFNQLRAANRDSLLWGCFDRARTYAILESAGMQGLMRKFDQLRRQPVLHYLLGPGMTSLAEADAYAAALRIDDSSLLVNLRAFGVSAPAEIRPVPTAAVPPMPSALEGECASALLYRDFEAVYAHRTELFDAQVLPRIAKGMGDLALFFSGQDLAEDVLPHVSPWIRVISRPVPFAEGAVPELELPAIAALVQVDDPDETGQMLVTAFQTMLGIINIDRAQKGLPGLGQRLSLEGELQITSGSFPKPRPGEGVDVQYNLQPACTLVGDTFVIGTHEALVREVAVQLRDGRVRRSYPGAERMSLSGPALAHYVRRNEEALVMQKVYEEGFETEEARGEIAGLHLFLDMIEALVVEVGYPSSDSVEVTTLVRIVAAPVRERSL